MSERQQDAEGVGGQMGVLLVLVLVIDVCGGASVWLRRRGEDGEWDGGLGRGTGYLCRACADPRVHG